MGAKTKEAGLSLRAPNSLKAQAALRLQLYALTGGHGDLRKHQRTCWASLTFAGTRHEMIYAFRGARAVEAGEAFIEALPEHEFDIPGQIVADASVRCVEHFFGDDEQLTVKVALLLVEDD